MFAADILTNMSVTQHLQQAGLLATRGRGEGGGQLVEVKLPDVQWDIRSRANFQMGHPHGVIT